MSSGWCSPEGPFNRLFEVESSLCMEEPLDLYNERYSRDVSLLNQYELEEDPKRYIDEVISYFDDDSSVLVFGSGHSHNMNEFYKCSNISSLAAWDFAKEAATGLNESIVFYDENILEDAIKERYDYVFTTHTLEHFSRKQLLTVVLPKLLLIAKKALVIIVPYKDAWGAEVLHKCRFFLNDELAALSDKVKLIRNDAEIVYWIEVI